MNANALGRMLEPLQEVWTWFRGLLPNFFRVGKLEFNFIMVHYLYMVGMSIAGSIMLFPAGIMDYIDALFFSAGATTQSGLNTIDVNKLDLYQQVVLMLIACVCNPIFINSAVTFTRLYWFKKRFDRIEEEANNQRRTKTRSRTKTEMKEEADPSREEMGVAGRPITVLHDTTKPNGMSGSTAKMKEEERIFAEKMGMELNSGSISPSPPNGSDNGSGESSSDATARVRGDSKTDEKKSSIETPRTPESEKSVHHLGLNPALANREITFADDLPKPSAERRDSSPERMPQERDVSQHIAFVEKQKVAKSTTAALRIPGPRGFDRGEMPEELGDSDDDGLMRPQTRNTLKPVMTGRSRRSSMSQTERLNEDDHPVRRGITINLPEHPAHREREPTVDDTEAATEATERRFGALHKIVSPLRHRRTRSQGVNITDRKSTIGRTFNSITTARTKTSLEDPMPYLSWQPTLGRNSQFVNLTEDQREELGGIEYRSLKTLAKILVGYFVGFHLLGMICLLPWMVRTAPWSSIAAEDGFNPAWWGIFTPASMFNDLGFTLTPDSMISFNTAVLPMLLGSFLIIIGNTGFPCMLRFTIWVMSKLVPAGSGIWEELRFLLDHPRRCFTLLFPSKATWWLFWILVLLNGVDLILFIILDLNDETVTSLAPGYRVLAGFFQAASTRTAGFAAVNLANLHPAIQVSYLVMMYISVFPIAISVRRTNVYEEKSLGIWGGEESPEDGEQSYVGQHLRRQLSFDLWYVFLGFFIICIVEGDRLENTNEYAFTMFSVLFEVVSAYGTVGLSLGYPTINASFSAEFRVISKLVIIAMMIRGRHRGLPYALDRAILLPSESLHRKEAEDATRRHERRNSMYPDEDTGGAAGAGTGIQRRGTWQEMAELDEAGLPKQHTGIDGVDPMIAGAGGIRSGTGMSRRGSGFSTVSKFEKHKHDRSRSLAQFVAGGLSAGPTQGRREHY